MECKALGLVEFALPFFCRVQWHGDNPIPLLLAQCWKSLTYQQIGEERFKPESPLVFVSMDDFEDHTAGNDGRTSKGKVKFQIPAVATFEGIRHLAAKWQATTPAKGWFDEPDIVPASRAHKTLASGRAFFEANLANIWINETQRCVRNVLKRTHQAHVFLGAAFANTIKVNSNTGKAIHPLTIAILPRPHSQRLAFGAGPVTAA